MKRLRNRAMMFVVAAWILLAVAIPVCLLLGAAAGIDKFYFPAYPQATLDAYDLAASRWIMACAALAAVLPSIAFVAGFRATASILVILIWTATLAGNQIARARVEPGPETYERHIGPAVFLVPWKYVNAGPGSPPSDRPDEIGFTVILCLSSLGGHTDIDCSFLQQLRILPADNDVADPTLASWRRYRPQMTQGPDHDGYRTFDLSYQLQPGKPARVQHYFARLNAAGEPTRLVVCRLDNGRFCSHRALVGDYWFGYDADLAQGDAALDARLAGLVESWRRR